MKEKTSKPSQKKLWEKVGNAIEDFIKSNDGIASMLEVYNITKQIIPNYVWSSEKLENLSKKLLEFGLFQIDLAIPHTKPLIIYPGHHSLKSTSFFVLGETDDDHESDVQKAKKLLDDLTKKAIEIKAMKRKKKKPENSEDNAQKIIEDSDLTPTKVYRKDQFRAKDTIRNGYIPMKKIRFEIAHLFIFETFSTNEFTIQDFINAFSVDLYTKIIGTRNVPDVFLREPKLRHILVSNLPKRIRDEIDFKEFKQIAKNLLEGASAMTSSKIFMYIYLKKKSKKSYQMVRTNAFNFFGRYELSYDFTNRSEIIDFHRVYQTISLMEFVDPHSVQLWLKQYSMNRKGRDFANPMIQRVIEKTIVPPFHITFPYHYAQVEQYISKVGFDWIRLLRAIENKFLKIDERLIQYPKQGLISDFCELKTNFEPNPTLYVDELDIDNFTFLKNFDINVIFNYLASISIIFPNGYIGTFPRQWKKMLKMIQTINKMVIDSYLVRPNNRHMFLMTKYKDYRDLFYYTTSNISSVISRFDINSDCYELTSIEYFNKFNVSQLRFRLNPYLGELIERLKIISMCPSSCYVVNKAKKLLCEIDSSDLNEAVFFLKLSRFLTQNVVEEENRFQKSSFKCTKAFQEFNLSFRPSYYKDIIGFIQASKDPELISHKESDEGSCTYILNEETPVSIILKPPKVDTINSKDIISNPKKSSMTESFKKIRISSCYQFVSTAINYPNLPEFEVNYAQQTEKEFHAIYKNYKGDYCESLQSTFMQLFILIYQTQDNTDLILLCRLLYSFILQHFSKGISLDVILNLYKSFNNNLIFTAMNYLEEFDYIYRINSNSLLPIYVSYVYGINHLFEDSSNHFVKPHFWVRTDGSIDDDMKTKLIMKTAEIINGEPGIDIVEIASKMSNLTLQDLILILDLLELDEVIYSIDSYDNINETLFDDDVKYICEKIGTNELLYKLDLSQKNPIIDCVHRNFYPTNLHHINLALATSNNEYN